MELFPNLQGYMSHTYAGVVGIISKQAANSSLVAGVAFAYAQFVIMAMYGLICWFAGLEITSGRADFESVLKVRHVTRLGHTKGIPF